MNIKKQIYSLLSTLFRKGVLSDELYLRIRYRLRMHRCLNLKNPKTFTEKLQWLKLYNRRPEYTIMADKVKVKEWVSERIGSQHIIPTLGVWERAEDIDFSSLPDKFVIKCNHNSGKGMYICKDKSKINLDEIRRKLTEGLNEDYYYHNGEWPYKDIPRRILAEKFMEEKGHSGDIADYKFFCFNGEPKYCQVIRDRNTRETIDFYDMDWNHQDFVGLNPTALNGFTPVDRPKHLDNLKDFCKKLANNMPFVRIDFYVVNDAEYFGEITFFPAGGMGKFTPSNYEEYLGKMINLPGENGGV